LFFNSDLRGLPLRFPAMFGVLARFREISVRALEHRILIPMAELLLHTDVPRDLMVFGFCRAFPSILVGLALRHDSTSCNDRGLEYQQISRPLTVSLFLTKLQ